MPCGRLASAAIPGCHLLVVVVVVDAAEAVSAVLNLLHLVRVGVLVGVWLLVICLLHEELLLLHGDHLMRAQSI